jgi:phosphoglycerate dehydrogenase-like enzyme
MRVVVHLAGNGVDRVRAALDAAGVPGVSAIELVGVEPDGPVPEDVANGGVDALLTSAIGGANLAELLDACDPEWIHTIGTGVDAFPLHLVGSRQLTCSRGASAVPISEWVLAMMLAFEQRLPEIWLSEPPARWHFAELGGLHGRTLGLVGLGGIGTAIAERALPFGMRVVALRRTAAPSPIAGVEIATDLETVLAVADHLVLAAPATAATRHLLDGPTLGRVRPGVHLVNIARGSLVDQDALRVALDDGRVARASLDTVTPEPLPAGHWMYDHPRVRLSAHVSWCSPDMLAGLYDSFVVNLGHRLAGRPLEGIVDVAAGY